MAVAPLPPLALVTAAVLVYELLEDCKTIVVVVVSRT